ncbi:pectinesterase [Ranunculus cassubicifolius]
MEPVNSFKGNDKDDEAKEREFRRQTRCRIFTIVLSIVVFITLIVSAVVGTLLHTNQGEKYPQKTSHMNRIESLKAVCNVTQYQESCFSRLFTANGSSILHPKKLSKLSMKVTVDELSKLVSVPDKLISKTSDPSVKAAFVICKSMFEDSIDYLNDSISLMDMEPDHKSSLATVTDDIKTWISSAITNIETCLDALDETEKGEFLQEMKGEMQSSKELTSNSLAIFTKIMSFSDNPKIPLHPKLLDFGPSDQDDFLYWVHPRDRRLFQQTMPRPDITVAQDGSGDYKTISDAVAAIGTKNESRTVVFVKAGTYVENVVVDKAYWNVMMYGEGMTKTIVTGNLSKKKNNTQTFMTATFIAAGKGFIARDMGFKNTAGPEGEQAVAMRSKSDLSVFYRCSFDAYQDTLYPHSNRQFYRNCEITGTVDFIFGTAAVVFKKCNIRPRQPLPGQFNTITAQGKKYPWQTTWISIHQCTIAPLGNVTAQTYLGRPWKEYSTTVIMETDITAIVNPLGWIVWNLSDPIPPSTINYGEYKNTGPGSDLSKRVNWTGYQPILSDQVAALYKKGVNGCLNPV